jgi:DNA adenine methylase
MSDSMNSPFRYPGGKFYARDLIIPHIPPHDAYLEPFAGGGSIFFMKEKAAFNQLNDADEELINTYLMIRDQPEELIGFLANEQATKERHGWYKNEFQPGNDLERAGRWYYLNRTSYSGIMKLQNCFWGYGDKYSMRPENWPRNIRRTSAKLQNVLITNWDFQQAIEGVPDGAFLFVDPPYYNADQDKFYNHIFTHDDHVRLAQVLHEHRHRVKFLITYDNCDDVRDLYEWATEMHGREWNYVIARTDDQKKEAKDKPKLKGTRGKGRELFIVNYISSELEQQYIGMQMAIAF